MFPRTGAGYFLTPPFGPSETHLAKDVYNLCSAASCLRSMRRSSLAWLAIFAAAACSPNKPPENDGEVATTSVPPTTSTPPAQTTGEVPLSDHELSPSDCKVMGEKYRALTISDQEKKLQPELRPEQREQGETAIRSAADKLSTRWTDACLGDLVGKFAPEESLKCAMSSKTVAAFDACLNAPPEPKK
jgi:hypothetical protein